MSEWKVILTPWARKDYYSFEGSQRKRIVKALAKLQSNPLPANEGGYGAPLANRGGTGLAGLLKVKLRGAGLRIVYDLVRVDDTAYVIVIGAREDSKVYEDAAERLQDYQLWLGGLNAQN